MYKMIVVDLDGTLLNDKKMVNEENINLIKRAYTEKKIITVIATGRPLAYANEICKFYKDCFGNYIIAANGAIIRDIKNNEYIHKITFTNAEILILRNIYLEEKADYMMLYTDKQAITEAQDYTNLENSGISFSQKKINVENLENIINENPNLIKLLCVVGGNTLTLEKIRERVNVIDGIEASTICNYLYKTDNYTYKSKYIDIGKTNCTKKNAINILAEKLGIKQEEIIVMGDGRKRLINV